METKMTNETEVDFEKGYIRPKSDPQYEAQKQAQKQALDVDFEVERDEEPVKVPYKLLLKALDRAADKAYNDFMIKGKMEDFEASEQLYALGARLEELRYRPREEQVKGPSGFGKKPANIQIVNFDPKYVKQLEDMIEK